MTELLTTKLYIPRRRANLVSRPRLTDRINAGLDKKITLISAPPGFGKTTLISEWIPSSPRCVTWFSVDEGDNDPTRFWVYFISSLKQLHPDLGSSALALLQSPQAPPINSIITAVINDITAFPDVFATVLDDYHVIDSRPIHEALIFLLDHLPKNMHLVITSRIDPPLPLARLRVHDELTELRANDLRFTPGETSDFLQRAMGLDLSVKEVAALEERTEGWIAGLQIAALSMQGRDDIQRFVHAFSGSHRHILGYLVEEVLDHQPEATQKFLLQTSILDRLCGPLCDEVTGDSGGQTILENLEHANLFITPMDDEGLWYRYHHLFAEVLQARFQQVHLERVPEYHRRAASWFVSQGMVEEAVRHALAGDDHEEGARLIESVAGRMVRKGSSASILRWLDAIPEQVVRTRPRLCIARGWACFMGPAFSLESAEEWAQLALRAAMAVNSPDPGLTGEVSALQAMIAATRSEVARSIELSKIALDHLPLDSPWRSTVAFCLGTAYYLSSDMGAATHALQEALKITQAEGEYYLQFAAASFLAEIQVFHGHLSRAMELYQQVLDWADHRTPQKGTVMAHGGCADILCEQNKLEAALVHIQLGADQVDQVGGAWAAHVLYRALARVQQAQGNSMDALYTLNQAYELGENAKVSLVIRQVAALRASLQLAEGDIEAAQAWVVKSGVNPDDADSFHPGRREVEYLTLGRVLNAQGKHMEALSLLDRLLQSAESEERIGSVISILVLQCLFVYAQRNKAQALMLLERALALAEPEGYVRIFVDEGEPMRQLLADIQSNFKQNSNLVKDNRSFHLLAYTDKLIAAFEGSTPAEAPKQEALLEPLSEREMDILRLIATGRSNQEIAEILVIALSTVKSHINHLYGKVGVHNRVQVVTLAREMGLLPE